MWADSSAAPAVEGTDSCIEASANLGEGSTMVLRGNESVVKWKGRVCLYAERPAFDGKRNI